MKNKLVLLLASAVTFGQLSASADSSFFVAPSFRGLTGTEYSGWESFTSALNGPNYPHLAGTTGNGFITQTTPGAFLTPNIYSFSSTNTFTLTDSLPFNASTVVFQARNGGGTVPFDYSSVRLEYDNGSGPQSLFTSRTELNNTGGGIASSWTWDVSALGINSYKIYFNASDLSLSLDAAALDVQMVPEPSVFGLAGLGMMMLGRGVFRRRA